MMALAHGEEVGGWVGMGVCPSFLYWSFSGGGGWAHAAPHSLPRILIPVVFISVQCVPCSVPGTC